MTTSRSLLLIAFLLAAPAFAQDEDALRERLLVASATTIGNEPQLLALATTLAESAITEHCAACHGATLEGGKGVPSLVDYEWI
ncbi:MAG: hypothetical protein ACO3PV_05505 [Pseudohongiellaceae bacterium]